MLDSKVIMRNGICEMKASLPVKSSTFWLSAFSYMGTSQVKTIKMKKNGLSSNEISRELRISRSALCRWTEGSLNDLPRSKPPRETTECQDVKKTSSFQEPAGLRENDFNQMGYITSHQWEDDRTTSRRLFPDRSVVCSKRPRSVGNANLDG